MPINKIMNTQSLKVVWVTGFSLCYFNDVFSKIYHTWNNLPGDIKFYLDEKINHFNDQRSSVVPIVETPPSYLKGNEIKFWKKGKSFIHSVKESKDIYDYLIWLDADVEILKSPDISSLLPAIDEAISANSKIPKNGTSIDTGFVAVNLKYSRLEEWINEYEASWNKTLLDSFYLKYDTYVIEHVLKSGNHQWKNLWSGQISKGKKRYCGFEDSDLEMYFQHHWGKKQKEMLGSKTSVSLNIPSDGCF